MCRWLAPMKCGECRGLPNRPVAELTRLMASNGQSRSGARIPKVYTLSGWATMVHGKLGGTRLRHISDPWAVDQTETKQQPPLVDGPEMRNDLMYHVMTKQYSTTCGPAWLLGTAAVDELLHRGRRLRRGENLNNATQDEQRVSHHLRNRMCFAVAPHRLAACTIGALAYQGLAIPSCHFQCNVRQDETKICLLRRLPSLRMRTFARLISTTNAEELKMRAAIHKSSGRRFE
ncbi:hypothetical protein IQ07DRAFT_91694 [Pyrenochaeta sp. DS3sAY3a]|nr:hypothetical protein IQ07DRAFT_91694 [Pyrenochaeta sp. DS3sAY3a]